MPAAHKNLVIDKGATFSLSVQYKNPDQTPIDLTGYTAEFVMSKRGTRFPIILTAVCSVDDQGYIVTKVSDEQTALIAENTYSYMLNVHAPGGDIYRLLTGDLKVNF